MTSCMEFAALADGAPQSAFLGKGSFGRVVQVADPVDPTQQRAVKLQKARFDDAGARDVKFITAEYDTIKATDRNPWVMKVFSMCHTPEYDVLVMERLYPFMDYDSFTGDFSSGLYSPKPSKSLKPTANTAFEVARDLVSGLVWMHADGMVHRDIKPANLAIRIAPNDPAESYRVVYIDLGLAYGGIQGCHHLGGGTEVYRPPEIRLTTKTIETLCQYIVPANYDGKHSACCKYIAEEADVWALGMTLLEFVTGHEIFSQVRRTFPTTNQGVNPSNPRNAALQWGEEGEGAKIPNTIKRLQKKVAAHPRYKATIDVIAGMLYVSLTPEEFAFKGGHMRKLKRPIRVAGGGEPVRLTAKQAYDLLAAADA